MEFEFIKGYENLYKINRNGDIYSCSYKKNMVQQKTEDGYLYVSLVRPSEIIDNKVYKKKSKSRIHRLLALQFIENPDNHPEVDHIDRNKNNNSLENLRWVTRTENRRNRPDIIENLTEEQLQQRKDKLREYKTIKAREYRLKKGCKLKSEMNITKAPDYESKKQKEYIARMTPEQKEAHLLRRRERRRQLIEEKQNIN
jgi:hypothetical protein